MLRKLTPEKNRVTDAMIFCIEHAEASDEIIEFITESLNSVKTPIPKKVGSPSGRVPVVYPVIHL